jgi:hypothetical protein
MNKLSKSMFSIVLIMCKTLILYLFMMSFLLFVLSDIIWMNYALFAIIFGFCFYFLSFIIVNVVCRRK